MRSPGLVATQMLTFLFTDIDRSTAMRRGLLSHAWPGKRCGPRADLPAAGRGPPAAFPRLRSLDNPTLLNNLGYIELSLRDGCGPRPPGRGAGHRPRSITETAS